MLVHILLWDYVDELNLAASHSHDIQLEWNLWGHEMTRVHDILIVFITKLDHNLVTPYERH